MSFRTLCSGAIEMQRWLALALGLLCLCRNLFSSQSYLGDDVQLDAMGLDEQASTKLHLLFGRLFLLMMCRRFRDLVLYLSFGSCLASRRACRLLSYLSFYFFNHPCLCEGITRAFFS